MIHAIILDDELNAIETLRFELSSFPELVSVAAHFTDPFKAKLFLEDNLHINCLFLDIQMPLINGFDFLKSLALNRPLYTVFSTAHNQYALEALKMHAFDYLLKPVCGDDVQKTLTALSEVVLNKQMEKASESESAAGSKRAVKIYFQGKIILLEPHTILYCEASGSYTRIMLDDQKTLLVSQSIGEMEDQLPMDFFFRIHKSYLVNLSHITEFNTYDNIVTIHGGMQLPVARRKKNEFIERL